MQAEKKKGILTRQRTFEKKDLKWDEKTIEEHDKDRGKTMKITEAKTPYNPEFDKAELEDTETDQLKVAEQNRKAYEHQMKGKLDIHQLNEMLKEDLDKERKEMFLDSDEENEVKSKKKDEFQKKRKAHYNEGAFIKHNKQMDIEDD